MNESLTNTEFHVWLYEDLYVIFRIFTINFEEKICSVRQDIIKVTWTPDYDS